MTVSRDLSIKLKELNLLLPLPVTRWVAKNLNPHYHYNVFIKEIDSAEYAPLTQRKQRQTAKLKKLLIHAQENNPFYKKRFENCGFDAGSLRSPEDLRQIPPLTRAEIRSAGDALISNGYPKDRLEIRKTSGTTGSSQQFYIDFVEKQYFNAIGRKQYRLAGIHPLDKGYKVKKALTRGRVLEEFDKGVFFSTMAFSPAGIDTMIDYLLKKQYKYMVGIPSLILLIARRVLERQLKINHIRAVIGGYETVLDKDIAVIEKALNAKYVNYYSTNEEAVIALDCGCPSGLHLDINCAYYEVLNKNGQPARTGKLVTTPLYKYGMPLVRYDTGDIVTLADGDCPCGRTSPRILCVDGRCEEYLINLKGQTFIWDVMSRTVYGVKGITACQFVQKGPEEVDVLVVPEPDFEYRKLKKNVKRKIGPGMTVNVRRVDQLVREPSGKTKFIINRFIRP